MPKLMCRKCGELCYLTELTSDGYCDECGEYYSKDFIEEDKKPSLNKEIKK